MKKIFFPLVVGTLAASTLLSCTDKDKNKVNPVVAVDTATIVTYSNVSFSLIDDESRTSGCFFSTITGESYKRKELNRINTPKVDLAFNSFSSTCCFFSSLDDQELFYLPGATKTKIIVYSGDVTSAEFDSMTNDSKLKTLIFNKSERGYFGIWDYPFPIILFKNAAGKIGAIKIKTVYPNGVDPRIVVDIKVQK